MSDLISKCIKCGEETIVWVEKSEKLLTSCLKCGVSRLDLLNGKMEWLEK